MAICEPEIDARNHGVTYLRRALLEDADGILVTAATRAFILLQSRK